MSESAVLGFERLSDGFKIRLGMDRVRRASSAVIGFLVDDPGDGAAFVEKKEGVVDQLGHGLEPLFVVVELGDQLLNFRLAEDRNVELNLAPRKRETDERNQRNQADCFHFTRLWAPIRQLLGPTFSEP